MSYSELAMGGPFLSGEQRRLKSDLRVWVDDVIYRRAETADAEAETRELVALIARRGLTRYVAQKAFGGFREKVQARDLCLIREELARGAALADFAFAMQGLGSYPITLAGTRAQKSRYLPPIIAGQHLAAFALTEPEAGSDVVSMQTQATKTGDCYSVSGIKRFISNAGIAQSYTLFAKTDADAAGKGISAFVVDPDCPGFTVREKTHLISPHPIGEIGFENCRIAGDRRLGAEGEGLKIALDTLALFRCTVGAAAVGMAQRALEEALRYASTRKQFGKKLAEFQATQFKLAEMATELQAARLLVYQAAWKLDTSGKQAPLESSMAKLYATEMAQRVIDAALQIHGGMGVVSGVPVERLYRDVRALRIYEGTSEIQHLIIARELLKKTL